MTFVRRGVTAAIGRLMLTLSALAAAAGISTLSGAAAGSPTTLTFKAAADAYVSSASPSANFGSETQLEVDLAPASSNGDVAHTYLRFDVDGLSGVVSRATLRLYALSGDKGGIDVRGVADNSWLEPELTWDNAPTPASSIEGSSGSFDAHEWVSIDVTPLVSGNGPVSIELESTSTMPPTEFASRESGENLAPQLIVETTAVPPSDQTPPTVAGTAKVGQTLTASAGTWSGTQPISFAYQWQRCDTSGNNCTDVSGATDSTYLVDPADAGSTLRVAVTASNAAGSSTAASAPTAVVTAPTPSDTSAPSAPANLSLTATTTSAISLSWSASTDNVGVAGYDVYLNGTKVGSTMQTSYSFTGLACGTGYTLGVVAFDAAGNRSSQSTLIGATAACTPSPPPPPSGIQHIVWVVMENRSYEEIIGDTLNDAYINLLAQTYGTATNMHAESHPSLPNYIAMTSGSTQGITDDSGPGSHPLNVPNIFAQLPAGESRSLEESMPSNCYKSDSGNYAVRHNPEVYYTNLGTDCGNFDVPFGSAPDLSAKFTFVTPNLCHDMHSNSCTGSSNIELQGDQFLQAYVPQLLASPQYQAGNTLIVITWDEDSGANGNHIPTILIYPSISHVSSGVSFTHYSMLKDVEDIFGLPEIGGAQSANSMRLAFGLP
jgi:phosphatidylinositol-3-phosphatase